jgi:hypothetical protein
MDPLDRTYGMYQGGRIYETPENAKTAEILAIVIK